VLVVENYPAICAALQEVLQETGEYKVATAPSAKAAQSLVTLERPDVAIVDLVLPGRPRGVQFASYLIFERIPVLLMTGEPRIKQRLDELALPHLGKPFHADDLLRKVRSALAQADRAIDDTREKLYRLADELAVGRARLDDARKHSEARIERTREIVRRSQSLIAQSRGMVERARLLDEAAEFLRRSEHCRQMARGVADPAAAANIEAYADELEAKARDLQKRAADSS
jgi:DNA-binding response OmpR family regulator